MGSDGSTATTSPTRGARVGTRAYSPAGVLAVTFQTSSGAGWMKTEPPVSSAETAVLTIQPTRITTGCPAA